VTEARSTSVLGCAETDENGHFEIRFSDEDLKDFLESRPDLYLRVFARGSKEPIHDTTSEPRRSASDDEYYEIEILRRARTAGREDLRAPPRRDPANFTRSPTQVHTDPR